MVVFIPNPSDHKIVEMEPRDKSMTSNPNYKRNMIPAHLLQKTKVIVVAVQNKLSTAHLCRQFAQGGDNMDRTRGGKLCRLCSQQTHWLPDVAHAERQDVQYGQIGKPNQDFLIKIR